MTEALSELPEEAAASQVASSFRYRQPDMHKAIPGWRNYAGTHYSQTPDLFSSISLAQPEQFEVLRSRFNNQGRRLVIGRLTAELLSIHDGPADDPREVVNDSHGAITAYGRVAIDRKRAELGLESTTPIMDSSDLEHKIKNREEEAKRMLLAGGAVVRVTFETPLSHPVWADVDDVMEALNQSQGVIAGLEAV